MKVIASALALFCLALPVQPVAAQEKETRVRIGLGAQYQPKFIGADDNRIAPYWSVSVKRGEGPFSFGAPDDSAGIGLIKSNGFSIGPVVSLEESRTNSEVGASVGTVKTTIEAGAFMQYLVAPPLRLRAEARKGLGGHDGIVGSLGADYILRDGDRYVVSIGPRLLASNGRYQRAYFGVTPAAALATGLPVYTPDGGIHAVAATSGAHVDIGGGWGLFGYARYERLVGDAAKSPIVRVLGSRDQYSGGLGLTRTFRLKL